MYTDEKRPDGEYIYQVIPVVEAVEEPKPKRPVWRRVLRAFLAISLFSMLWSAFVPMPSCNHAAVKQGEMHPPHHPHVRPSPPPQHGLKPEMKFNFPVGLKDFKIKQTSISIVPSLVNTVGSVNVGSCDKAEHISVKFYISVSDDSLLDKIKIKKHADGLEIITDPVVLIKQDANITAYVVVPKGEEHKMKTFQVETKGLDIRLAPSFQTMVNGTYFETTTGHIYSDGDDKMDVVFSPYLSAKSASGDIKGRFPLGYTLDAESGTGNIDLKVTAAPFKGEDMQLKTKAGTGETNVKFVNDIPTRTLFAYHKSGAGAIYVDVPEAYQGEVTGTSATGDVDIVGDSIQIVERERSATKNLLRAIKGNGPGKIELLSVSGKLQAIVGNWKDRPKNDE